MKDSTELKKSLSLIEIFCIASGAMISSGLFILPGIAHAQAGPAVIISYFLAGILSLAGMLSIVEMTTAMPKAGGDCFAIIRSMGPAVGTAAGLLSWFSLSMKSAFALVGMSVFTVLIVDINIHIIAVFFCLLFLFINLIGIREAGKTQVILVFSLIGLMFVYVVRGIPSVDIRSFEPFAPEGITSVFSTAGFVFVSYGGLLKIASVAEEIENPKKIIPMSMILSLSVVSIIYSLVIFVTSGVLEAQVLHKSLTPISDGAAVFMGSWGKIALSIAAVLAFLSTANAGIMTAARSLVPLSRDNLIPGVFGRINSRFQTPHYSLLVTGLFIIISLFLQLKVLVEAASIVLILTNLLSCFSVIILRESRIQNYRPSFQTPFYPWLQILGILGLTFVMFEMGREAIMISLILITIGFLSYFLYGRTRNNREYALLHLIERITARELTERMLETELKEIIRERDEIVVDRFDRVIENSIIMDINKSMKAEEFLHLVAEEMAPKLELSTEVMFKTLVDREKQSSTVLTPYLAIPHIITPGENKFDILMARCHEGILFSEEAPEVHAVFVLAGTKDERNFHLHSLASIAQIVQESEFVKNWMSARNKEDLRDIILLGRRQR
ncbi:amino acid permease [Candidatus Poribacteria bacterium]|nr:amino acid permease [Candidatus Poribacteria bacterium]